jgi:outer membrane cobalamin receptor
MLSAILLSFMLAAPAVNGVVKDSTGGTVSGATVVIRNSSGAEMRTVSGTDGRFSFPNAPDGQTTITVRAGGFAEATKEVSGSQDVEIVLALPQLNDTVTVTATRSEITARDVPASIDVISREQISQSPAIIADDVLRRIPTFSLFRRTSSLSAHPTFQGVSLRGIGPSGAGRTLVLIDNVPFNDPFGGWVYWTRVPLDDVERIEVVNSSSSSLYGSFALGGVINVVSRRPTPRTLEVKSQYGSLNSPKVDFFGSDVWGKVGLAVNGSLFDTEGFPQVIGTEIGKVDTKAAVEFKNINVKLDYSPTGNVSAFLRGGYFTEDRNNAKTATANGTPVGTPTGTPETNHTVWKSFNAGVRVVLDVNSVV